MSLYLLTHPYRLIHNMADLPRLKTAMLATVHGAPATRGDQTEREALLRLLALMEAIIADIRTSFLAHGAPA